MKTPITPERLKHHLTYSWWKYLAAIAACLLAWNVFFSVTRTRASEDEKVELYVYGNIMESIADALLEEMRRSSFPEQAEFDCYAMPPSTTAGIQSFTVRVAMGDGDLLLMTREVYENFAQQGILADLDTLPGVREAALAHGVTVDPARDYWRGRDGAQRFYGIPVSRIAVLNSLMVADGNEYYLAVRVSNGNEDTVTRVLITLLEDWTEGGETFTRLQLEGVAP